MDDSMMAILIIAGVAVVVIVLRFALRSLVNKGSDAIGNAYRARKNAAGPSVCRLADMYPEIAAWHQQNGTAKAADPALMSAAPAAAAVATPAAATVTAAPAAMAPAAAPAYAPVAYSAIPVAKLKRKGVAANVLTVIVALLGIVVNGWLLLEILRSGNYSLRNFSGLQPAGDYHRMLIRLSFLFVVVSLAAYIVILVTRRLAYAGFFPVMAVVNSVVWYLALEKYRKDFKEFQESLNNRTLVPRGLENAEWLVLLSIIAAAVLLVFFFLYLAKKRFRWALWVGLAAGAGATVCSLLALMEMVRYGSTYEYVPGNYFGFALLALVAAYGYVEREKQ